MRSTAAAFAALVWLCAGAVPVAAACSNAAASAKAQEFGTLMKQKMATKPDEAGDLADEFGTVMTDASRGVSDETCIRLDAIVKKARAL